MASFKVNDRCTGCLACVQNCPADALRYVDANHSKNRTLSHNLMACARCGTCWRICPEDAIEFQHLLKGEWEEVISLKLAICSVCGEPIGTVPQMRNLRDNYGQQGDNLCFLHRGAARSDLWYQAAISSNKPA